LDDSLENQSKADAAFESNWGIVKDWSEQARYEDKSRQDAQALFDAVCDQDHGIMTWVRQYW
jgi:hypothetical protein